MGLLTKNLWRVELRSSGLVGSQDQPVEIRSATAVGELADRGMRRTLLLEEEAISVFGPRLESTLAGNLSFEQGGIWRQRTIS
jgi:hypothetical protein